IESSKLTPFLLGAEPFLPDFQLFHTLEVSRTFANIFEMPMLDLLGNNPELQGFYDAMCERSSTRQILAHQAAELAVTKKELFEEFGNAYLAMLDKRILEGMFGHAV